MSEYPTALRQPTPDRLLTEWSDGMQRECTIRELRSACPCATCREKRSQPPPAPSSEGPSRSLPILSNAELQPLRIVKMHPLGNYAYNVAFSDGHDTGIYPFELLRELGTEARP